MKIFILIFCLAELCSARKCIVDTYLEGIVKLHDQIKNWTYPKNSNNYVGENFDAQGK